MITLLERQANIVPAHLFTQEDVRRIVTQKVQKREDLVRREFEEAFALREERERERKKWSEYIGFPEVLLVGVGVAGAVVLRRACSVVSVEMGRWIVWGAVGGGVVGVVGACVVKGVVFGVERWWVRRGL